MFADSYLHETAMIIAAIDRSDIDRMVCELVHLRERGGRLFILGNGGGAANAAHAVNDFRKICRIEAYSATDNIAELTARANDDGWDKTFIDWLTVGSLNARDALLIFSVGGGTYSTSQNIARAVEMAAYRRVPILGIVGGTGGMTKQHATACVRVPTVNVNMVTPHVEEMQAIIWHLIVSDPRLKP